MFTSDSVFVLDGFGYAAVIHLVQARVESDIKATRRLIAKQRHERKRLTLEPTAWFRESWLTDCSSKIARLSNHIASKRTWLESWIAVRWQAVTDLGHVDNDDVTIARSSSLATILAHYDADPNLRIKKFLVLQEAVLLPLYTGDVQADGDVSEVDATAGYSCASLKFGFQAAKGAAIVSTTESFLRDESGRFIDMVFWSLVAALVAAVTLGVTAPAIAGAIGGLMGLHGAAAFSAGMALLGGGSIAAGGAGMAGGFAVLVGGGALLASSSAAGVVALGSAKPEFVALSAAKIFGFAQHLRKQSTTEAEGAFAQTIASFLSLKHEAEKVFLTDAEANRSLDAVVKTLHFTLGRLAELD